MTGSGVGPASTALAGAALELRTLLEESREEIEALASDFQTLAHQTEALLAAAASMVDCPECEGALSVVAEVQPMAEAARVFLRDRILGANRILATVTAEAALLNQLAQLTRAQKAIVRETDMLRVLTNIEVARLGAVGAGFEHLALELDDFSQAVSGSIGDLTLRTEERRSAVEEIRRALAVEIPRMRRTFAEAEQSLSQALTLIEPTVLQLSAAPAGFRGCVEEVAEQIAGVVAAIQTHDITRQQIEHAGVALETIAATLSSVEGGTEGGITVAEMRAGLTVQSYQLQAIRVTVTGWTAQIRACLDAISRITAAELAELGPRVMAQERALAAQLDRIEGLEQDSLSGNEQVEASLAALAELMKLVGEHLRRSESVRDRLQLLMFNSMIEASHLGTQADGILEISTSIQRISAAWSALTGRSEQVTRDILALMEQNAETLKAFSSAASGGLRQARAKTRDALEVLCNAARTTEARGHEIRFASEELQGKLLKLEDAGDRLHACFGRLGKTLATIEDVQERIGKGGTQVADAARLEELFGKTYTTEREREILRAAVSGEPLPVVRQTFAGNGVELF